MKTYHQHLRHLRTKPDHVKQRIAFVTSLGVSSIIFVFWIVSLSVGGVSTDAAVAKKADVNAPSPFSSLSASVSDAVGSFGTAFSGFFSSVFPGGEKSATTDTSSSVELVPGNR